MRPSLTIAAGWLAAILRSLGWGRQAARPGPSPVDPVPGTDLVAVINEARARHGVGPVSEDLRLDQAARIQSDWQALREQLGHEGPPSMPWTTDRLARCGLETGWSETGEICAVGQSAHWPDGTMAIDYDFRTACRDWLSSPGHRAILLDPKFTHSGAYMSTGRRGRLYSTAVFVRLAR